MDNEVAGLPVFTIEGRRIGVVAATRECCWTIETTDGQRLAVVTSAVLSGEHGSVSLICGRLGLARYACAAHAGSPSHPVSR